MQRVDDLVNALIEGRSGKLNIVCSPSLGVHLVPRAIARFHRQYPELPIHFEPLTYNNLVPRVLLGENYLGVSLFEVAHPNLTTESLASVPLMCAAPAGRLADRDCVRLDELRGERWIGYGTDTPLGRIVGAAFGDNRPPAPIVEVRSAFSACQFVREGIGVALVDPFCVDATLREHIDVRPVEPVQSLSVHALYLHSEPLSHSARSFLNVLRTVFEDAHPQLAQRSNTSD